VDEDILSYEPLTPQLPSIKTPTMIMTGEFDFLTPRKLQDSLRVHIPNSAMVILPRAYHAFTLEKPDLTAYLLAHFAEDVIGGCWPGNRTIWVGPEQVGGDLTPFPAEFDHLRAIPVRIAVSEAARRGGSRAGAGAVHVQRMRRKTKDLLTGVVTKLGLEMARRRQVAKNPAHVSGGACRKRS
jgi:hypothetical protein